MGPAGAQFLGPVVVEIPHFAALRGEERELVILRSEMGESWREHHCEHSEEDLNQILNGMDEELDAPEELERKRICRIITRDFPQFFAVVSRVRQDSRLMGPEGGVLSSSVVPQVQAHFPEGALTKRIRVGLQAQPIEVDLVRRILGNKATFGPIVTLEPRRRKFHKPITMTIPIPKTSANEAMARGYGGDMPTLRLLCSITGGTTPAQWEDITGTTPLTFTNDCVSFTTNVSARFWLVDCLQVQESVAISSQVYREVICVPYMAKFVIFAKTLDSIEARLRCFCMTDDKMDKTLEQQENFTEVARSRDVEVLEGKPIYADCFGNLVPLTKSGQQHLFSFFAFKENRLALFIKIRDSAQEPCGRLSFTKEPRAYRSPTHKAVCNLNITLPAYSKDCDSDQEADQQTDRILEKSGSDLLSEVSELKRDLIKMTVILTSEPTEVPCPTVGESGHQGRSGEEPGEPLQIMGKVKEDLEKVDEILRGGSYMSVRSEDVSGHEEEGWVFLSDAEIGEAKKTAQFELQEPLLQEIMTISEQQQLTKIIFSSSPNDEKEDQERTFDPEDQIPHFAVAKEMNHMSPEQLHKWTKQTALWIQWALDSLETQKEVLLMMIVMNRPQIESSGKTPLSPDTPSSEEVSYEVTPKTPDPQAQPGFKKPPAIPEDAEEGDDSESSDPQRQFTPEEEMFKMAAKIKTFDEMEQDAKAIWDSRNDVKTAEN
ncbi:hypothetical protein SKAU_G00147660 [Synaphobranchus kaupii]|uniref:ZU5 domain-containing protein n=1 Tax=Synaphobranchus kaupii TaxID=118154 RepID=A0A9Q1FTH7_SYNKA|nr:hypothetical protein SKAU_G00147660 [Synaphobranchus kaupii]